MLLLFYSLVCKTMARRHSREGGNHLDYEGNRQTTMEDIDGGLHPAVDGQSLDKDDIKKKNRNRVKKNSYNTV